MTADEGTPGGQTPEAPEPDEGSVTDPAHRVAVLVMVLAPVALAALVYLALKWTAG